MTVKKVGLVTAISIVVANIIGTGVFTSIGFQVVNIQSVFPLIMLWITGGLLALFGALSYSELASAMPKSGGEYFYLSRLYHPSVGFMGGWVSVFVGFSAPVAAAAMAFSKYFTGVFPGLPEDHIAAGIVLIITAVHSFKVEAGSAFQVFFTTIKVLLIIVFIGAGFFFTPVVQDISILPKPGDFSLIISPFFAISLIFVSYSYSGWNAATYIASEIINPGKNIPRALFIGTVIVIVLYALLNFVFLYTTPMAEFTAVASDGTVTGRPEAGLISARYIFGEAGGDVMGLIISALLVSTISAMVFIGPRVIQAMSLDMFALRFFSKESKYNVPVRAIVFQSLITVIFIYTSSFESVINYAGFTLNLFTLLTVFGLFILRWRNRGRKTDYKYKTWGYPVVPAIFILLNLWILTYLLLNKTLESVLGLATVLVGFIFYFVLKDEKSDEV